MHLFSDISAQECFLACLFLAVLAGNVVADQGDLERMTSMHQYVATFGLDDVFFEIVHPPQLQYSYLVQVTHHFGAPFNATMRNVRLTLVDPPQACGPLFNCAALRGSVALIERGECQFIDKVLAVADCGALAAIVHDNDAANVSDFLEMTAGDAPARPHIPAAFLLGSNGYAIRSTLRRLRLNEAIINIPVNASMRTIADVKQPPWVTW